MEEKHSKEEPVSAVRALLVFIFIVLVVSLTFGSIIQLVKEIFHESPVQNDRRNGEGNKPGELQAS